MDEQRCWNHTLTLLGKLHKDRQARPKIVLRMIGYVETVKEAVRLEGMFQACCRRRGYDPVAGLIAQQFEPMLTYCQYPKQPRIHLGRLNPEESPFAAGRFRTSGSRRSKKVQKPPRSFGKR